MNTRSQEHRQEPLTLYIFRLEKTDNYARIANAVFEDSRLSWEARGLLGYLLTKPDDWRVRLHDLIARGPAGEHKVRRILRELEEFGYLYRQRLRRNDGTFGWLVFVLEHPSLVPAIGLEPRFGPPIRRRPAVGSSTPGFSAGG